MTVQALSTHVAPSWACLEGHVAVVTGGNAGIGLSFARGLARAGASVVIVGRRPDRNRAAVAQLAAEVPGSQLLAVDCDVAEGDAIRAALGEAHRTFGRIDSCFVNAGITGNPQPMMSTSGEDWRAVLGVNLDGAFTTAREAAEVMRANGEGGSIVFTSSISAFDATPANTPYAASKAAVLAVMRSMAVALARDGIRVNAIVPGWFETAMTTEVLANDTAARKILSRIPLHRLGRPEDLEALAVLLAGPGSAYLTGQALVVDGGYTIF